MCSELVVLLDAPEHKQHEQDDDYQTDYSSDIHGLPSPGRTTAALRCESVFAETGSCAPVFRDPRGAARRRLVVVDVRLVCVIALLLLARVVVRVRQHAVVVLVGMPGRAVLPLPEQRAVPMMVRHVIVVVAVDDSYVRVSRLVPLASPC